MRKEMTSSMRKEMTGVDNRSRERKLTWMMFCVVVAITVGSFGPVSPKLVLYFPAAQPAKAQVPRS